MNSRNTTKMVEHKFVLFATFQSFLDPCNFTNKANWHTSKLEIHIRSKLCHFVGRYVVRAKLFCLKRFNPVTGLECSYGKIFIPVTEISVAKTEISVTGPARTLIRTHRYFYKEKAVRRDLGNRASPVDRAHMKRPSDLKVHALQSLFFLYANIFLSQFEPLFRLPRHTLFCGMFLKPFKNLAARVLSGLKTLGYASCFYTSIKPCCSIFKHYINY